MRRTNSTRKFMEFICIIFLALFVAALVNQAWYAAITAALCLLAILMVRVGTFFGEYLLRRSDNIGRSKKICRLDLRNSLQNIRQRVGSLWTGLAHINAVPFIMWLLSAMLYIAAAVGGIVSAYFYIVRSHQIATQAFRWTILAVVALAILAGIEYLLNHHKRARPPKERETTPPHLKKLVNIGAWVTVGFIAVAVMSAIITVLCFICGERKLGWEMLWCTLLAVAGAVAVIITVVILGYRIEKRRTTRSTRSPRIFLDKFLLCVMVITGIVGIVALIFGDYGSFWKTSWTMLVIFAAAVIYIFFCFRQAKRKEDSGESRVFLLELVDLKVFASDEFRQKENDLEYMMQLERDGLIKTVYLLSVSQPFRVNHTFDNQGDKLQFGYLLYAQSADNMYYLYKLNTMDWPIITGKSLVSLHPSREWDPHKEPIRLTEGDCKGKNEWMFVASMIDITDQAAHHPSCRLFADKTHTH